MTYTAQDRARIMDRRYRKQRLYKIYKGIPTGLVPADEASDHVRTLADLGWSFKALSHMTDGVCDLTLNNLANGRHPMIERKTAAAALAIPYTLAPNDRVDPSAYVPTIGAQRRVHALLRRGWPHDEMRRRSTGTTHLARGSYKQMTTARWRLIDDMFRELCMTAGPSDITATRARVAGLPTVLAWDDIDAPDATPVGIGRERGRAAWDVDRTVVARLLAGERVPSTRAEKEEAIRRWTEAGNSVRSLCVIHGWNDQRYKPTEDAA